MERLKIRFTPSFVIFIAMAMLLRRGHFAIQYFLAVLLHELSHYVVADRLFYRCYEVRVSVFGAVLYGDFADISPRDRILVALAGPAANLVCVALCFALWWVAPSMYVGTEYFFSANITMAVVNMLPCYPLDGGRVLSGLLEKCTTNGVKIAKVCTWIVGSGLFALFVVSLFVGANLFGVGLFALGLLCGVVSEANECYVKLGVAHNLWKRHGMEKKSLVFTADSKVADVAKRINGNYLYCLDVVDESLLPVASFDVAQTESILLHFDGRVALKDVVSALEKVENGG